MSLLWKCACQLGFPAQVDHAILLHRLQIGCWEVQQLQLSSPQHFILSHRESPRVRSVRKWHLVIRRANPGLLELDPCAEVCLGAAHMQRAIMVNVGGANDEVLDGGHQRIPAEGLAIMEVNTDEPRRPALDTVGLCRTLDGLD